MTAVAGGRSPVAGSRSPRRADPGPTIFAITLDPLVLTRAARLTVRENRPVLVGR